MKIQKLHWKHMEMTQKLSLVFSSPLTLLLRSTEKKRVLQTYAEVCITCITFTQPICHDIWQI